jgi:type IV secretion system protein VirB9
MKYYPLLLLALVATNAAGDPVSPDPSPSPSTVVAANPSQALTTGLNLWNPPRPAPSPSPANSIQIVSTDPAPDPTPAPTPKPDLLKTLADREDRPTILSDDEARAVGMTEAWRERTSYYQSQSSLGAVQYTWGEELPSVVCAVLQVTDVSLEPGENVTSVSVGDNLRWSVEAVTSGQGADEQPHLIIKPFSRGLETSVVVTTTKRTYHLSLRSTDEAYVHEVSFRYPGEPKTTVAFAQATPAPTPALPKPPSHRENDDPNLPASGHRAAADPELVTDPDTYRIIGSARWKPAGVKNDGRKTYIFMTEQMKRTEAPALLVLRRNKYLFGYDKVLANYRLQHKIYIVDTIFDRAILVSGQDKVTIFRIPGKTRTIALTKQDNGRSK